MRVSNRRSLASQPGCGRSGAANSASSVGGYMPEASSYLIRGGRVYDHDGDIHQPATADILIRGVTIERIAPQIVAGQGVEIVEAAGKLVVPGFVNAHYHSHDVMSKGLFEEMPF